MFVAVLAVLLACCVAVVRGVAAPFVVVPVDHEFGVVIGVLTVAAASVLVVPLLLLFAVVPFAHVVCCASSQLTLACVPLLDVLFVLLV